MEPKAIFHLPGLFEFYELYKVFLPIFKKHRDFFYDWCDIGSIYGAPGDALWGGGRVGFGDQNPKEVLELINQYDIEQRLTFSNSLIEDEHLSDKKCNELLKIFSRSIKQPGVIIYSDRLLNYIKNNYDNYYFVSSTTKVITDINELIKELDNDNFRFVVPDFRFNYQTDKLDKLTSIQKSKVELLVNECCDINCKVRKECYENVSRKSIGELCEDHVCGSDKTHEGYKFSKAMRSRAFIGIEDIRSRFLPMGITNFKIEGRSLGSAVVLEFLLYYLTKPEHQLEVREMIYLDSMLDLF